MSSESFEFEKPIVELEQEIVRVRESTPALSPEQVLHLADLERRLEETRREIYDNLTAWQRVRIGRHLARPHALDYIRRLLADWTELHGDRTFSDDHAVVCGFASFAGRAVAVIGQQKGADVKENVFRNYGSMHPEGYRKALRVMKLAEKFGRPILVFIDTAGAYPGVGAEERGQGEAIARNIMEMSVLRVPILCTVIGEGGSGGALGVGMGDRLLMQENAFYSVISPEGCASILWRDARFAPQAAESLRLTARDLLDFGIIDEIVTEPPGGAHRNPTLAAELLRLALARHLGEVLEMGVDDLLERRFQKYRKMGVCFEEKSLVLDS
jgi:acetyl-CoA carboxylase carboxyl transferase subunit alpha